MIVTALTVSSWFAILGMIAIDDLQPALQN